MRKSRRPPSDPPVSADHLATVRAEQPVVDIGADDVMVMLRFSAAPSAAEIRYRVVPRVPWLRVAESRGSTVPRCEPTARPERSTIRLTTSAPENVQWDAEGRLSRVMRGDVVEEYVYGFDDARTIKRSRTPSGIEETRYVDRDVEIRAGGMVRYVFLGEERAIRIDDVPDDPTSMSASVIRVSDVAGTTVLLALGSLLVVVLVTRRRGALVLLLGLTSCGEDIASLREVSVPITEWPASAVLYLSDLAATPVALADARGAVIQRWAHHPYGAVRVERGDVSEPYGYVGNERDRVSGLSDFNARPYRPEVGRFLAVEPRLHQDLPSSSEGASRFYAYAYAAGDPSNRHDANGRFVVGLGLTGSGSAIAGFEISAGLYLEVRIFDANAGRGRSPNPRPVHPGEARSIRPTVDAAHPVQNVRWTRRWSRGTPRSGPTQARLPARRAGRASRRRPRPGVESTGAANARAK